MEIKYENKCKLTRIKASNVDVDKPYVAIKNGSGDMEYYSVSMEEL